MSEGTLLEVAGLHVDAGPDSGPVHAVRGVTFSLPGGGRLGIVGESGCGKSMTVGALIGLLPRGGRITAGTATFDGRDLLALPEAELAGLRGRDIAIVFQNARTALNPLFSIGEQIADVFRYRRDAEPRAAWERAVEVLDEVGMPDAEARALAYPHELSGGMAQRAMIAMALVCSPRLLIADEPTSGLDTTIEAQVLDLIDERLGGERAALILISHDLAVVGAVCDEVVVMYAGEVFEAGPLELVFERPANPYTRALIESSELHDDGRPRYIAGAVPDLHGEFTGCAFADRCPMARERCRVERPSLRPLEDGRLVTCHFAEEALSHAA